MQWRLGLFLIGGVVGASVLVVGQYVARQHDPSGSGGHAPIIPTAQPENGIEMSDRGDLSDVLKLPTEFARRSALHGLAARSDSRQLQALIADASQISGRRGREIALTILFRRFCDFDPRAALALANTDPYAKTQWYRDVVWQTWAQNDLADAISAVKALAVETDKVAAVQNLYAAYDYMGNENTDQIFSETGIEQNRQTRLRYLRVLLRDSPVHVVNFINTEPSRLRRDEYINWFAYALDVNDPDAAYSYVGSFESLGDRTLYKSTIDSRFSRLNPVDTVWRTLAEGKTGPNSEFHDAITELASQDVDAAIDIFEQIESSNARVLTALVIAHELANTNPQRALEWLRSLEDIRTDKIEEALLATIAVSDPHFALETALALPAARRESAISNMVMKIALSSPEQAASLLSLIPEEVDLSRTLRMFGSVWLTKSPPAAIGWLESLESDQAAQIAEFTVKTTMRTQPETAIRLLSFLDAEKAANSAGFIVSELAAMGDVDWALTVMEELRGRDIQGLEPSVAKGLANHSPHQAIQYVQQLADKGMRDAAFAGVAQVVVLSGTEDATAVLPTLINSIEDDKARSKASRVIMMRLMRADKERASQLLERLRISENDKKVYRQIMLGPND